MFDDADLVGEAMSPHPRTCLAQTSVSHIARTMVEHKIDALPVVADANDTRIIGLVTSADLLWLLVDSADADVLPIVFNMRLAAADGRLPAAA
jgi:CBS-domain-containing membrane protein